MSTLGSENGVSSEVGDRKMKTFLQFVVGCVLIVEASTVACQTGKPAPQKAPQSPAQASPVAGPTPEQRAIIAQLREEVARIDEDLAVAKIEDDKLKGGLIKAQIGLRMEIMLNTRALIQQRIRVLELGAKLVPIEVAATQPDPTLVADIERDIVTTKEKIVATKEEAAKYRGGLILAQLESAIATQEGTLAMLQQRQMMAKYGLARTTVPDQREVGSRQASSASTSSSQERKQAKPSVADTILTVNLLGKRRTKQKYGEFIFFDLDLIAEGLDRPARAIKGVMKFTDLFGEAKVHVNWTLDDPVTPGATIVQRGVGPSYNQFTDTDRWLDNTALTNMRAVFTVKSILYEDGTRKDF